VIGQDPTPQLAAMEMSLYSLLAALPEGHAGQVPDVHIQGITSDSRAVEPGYLFVAIRGAQTDGHLYLGEAERRGAGALVVEADAPQTDIPAVRVRNSRLALARMAAAWHGHPGRSLVVVGVTGTDGKTTTASMIHAILTAAGLRAGLVTTVSALIGTRAVDTGFHVTTPDPMALQGYLAQMVDAGQTHVVLEATSHGLAQHRVDGCEFDVAVFTNITHEHLDFHGTYAAYRQAKGRLLDLAAASGVKSGGPAKAAVVNADDPGAAGLAVPDGLRRWTSGLVATADVRGRAVRAGSSGVHFTIEDEGLTLPIDLALMGDYNVLNALAAYACCVKALGVAPNVAQRGLGATEPVPGRMQPIDMGQPFQAIVDFAHTPNALRRALSAAREMTTGRVIAVFGSAGLRDREKRRMMAEISARLADITILTAEDPRTESLSSILSEMAHSATEAGACEGVDLWRIPDRGQAVLAGLRMAGRGDLVIVCGKGHEQSMCFGTTEYAWDDRTAMRAGLAHLLGVEGPRMPELPTSRARAGA
jgi:UDP-N-acetylmuramoyl-L-alanyl-D-glutamate--2,6-diaminopimelate ligase